VGGEGGVGDGEVGVKKTRLVYILIICNLWLTAFGLKKLVKEKGAQKISMTG